MTDELTPNTVPQEEGLPGEVAVDGPATSEVEPSIAEFTARDAFAESLGDNVSADQVVEVRGNGFSRTTLISEPMSIAALFDQEGLTVNQRATLWVDGNEVPWEHVVAPGATISIVGAAIKGG